MKKFLIGLVVGAAGLYVASKLIDDETKEEIYDRFGKAKDDAEYQFRKAKRKAMRAGLKAKNEVLAGRDKAARLASDLVGKVSNDIDELDEKLKHR